MQIHQVRTGLGLLQLRSFCGPEVSGFKMFQAYKTPRKPVETNQKNTSLNEFAAMGTNDTSSICLSPTPVTRDPQHRPTRSAQSIFAGRTVERRSGKRNGGVAFGS